MQYRFIHIAVALAVLFIALPLLVFSQEPPPEKQAPKDQLPKPRLDLYGDPLPEGAIRRFGSLRFRHIGGILSVDYSPDGKTIASGGRDWTARIWDGVTGKEIHRWEVDGKALAVGFSPDGKTLACGVGEPGTSWGTPKRRAVLLWDTATGEEIGRLGDLTADIRSIAFSTDGERLAAGTGTTYDEGHGIYIWKVSTGERLQAIEKLRSIVLSVAFSPDGKWLASGDRADTIRIWDTSEGKELKKLGPFADNFTIYAVAFSPDGKWLASGHRDGKIRVWNTQDWEMAQTLEGHASGAQSLDFSRDGRRLASGSYDGVVIWDGEAWRLLRRCQRRDVPRNWSPRIASVAFSPDGKTVVTGGEESKILFWDVGSGREQANHLGHKARVNALAFTPDGRSLVSGGGDETLRLWDVTSGRQILKFSGESVGVAAVAVSPDGKTIASTDQIDRGHLWETSTGKLLRQWPSPDWRLPAELRQLAHRVVTVGPWTTVEFTPDGRTLLVGSASDAVLRVGVQSDEFEILGLPRDENGMSGSSSVHRPDPPRLAEIFHRWTFRHKPAALSPDGETAIFRTRDSTLVARHLPSGREWFRQVIPMLEGSEGSLYSEPRTLAISPDGQTVALGKGDGTVELWEFFSSRKIRDWKAHEFAPLSLDFSPCGDILATTSVDSTIRLWDVSRGKELRRLTGYEGWAQAVRFSPDGKTLASAGMDTTVLLWDVEEVRVNAPAPGGAIEKKDLEALWVDLAGEDPAKACVAIWTLAAYPDGALSLIKDRLPARVPGDPEKLRALIARLDDVDFARREEATKRLKALGDAAGPHLLKSLEDADCSPELRIRVETILRSFAPPYRDVPSENMRGLRSIQILEKIGTAEATEVLNRIAGTFPLAIVQSRASQAAKRVRSASREF